MAVVVVVVVVGTEGVVFSWYVCALAEGDETYSKLGSCTMQEENGESFVRMI